MKKMMIICIAVMLGAGIMGMGDVAYGASPPMAALGRPAARSTGGDDDVQAVDTLR